MQENLSKKSQNHTPFLWPLANETKACAACCRIDSFAGLSYCFLEAFPLYLPSGLAFRGSAPSEATAAVRRHEATQTSVLEPRVRGVERLADRSLFLVQRDWLHIAVVAVRLVAAMLLALRHEWEWKLLPGNMSCPGEEIRLRSSTQRKRSSQHQKQQQQLSHDSKPRSSFWEKILHKLPKGLFRLRRRLLPFVDGPRRRNDDEVWTFLPYRTFALSSLAQANYQALMDTFPDESQGSSTFESLTSHHMLQVRRL